MQLVLVRLHRASVEASKNVLVSTYHSPCRVFYEIPYIALRFITMGTSARAISVSRLICRIETICCKLRTPNRPLHRAVSPSWGRTIRFWKIVSLRGGYGFQPACVAFDQMTARAADSRWKAALSTKKEMRRRQNLIPESHKVFLCKSGSTASSV